jgi:hypothetical protein
MSERTFDEYDLEGILSVETIIDFEEFKIDVNDDFYRLDKELKNLRNEYDEKAEIAQKQMSLAALCLMEKAIRKSNHGYDRFLGECENDKNKREFQMYLLSEKDYMAMRMRTLFMQCIDFPKSKKPKKA